MGKITYWMKKLGMLRTSTYAVKGDAEKLNEMTATDGGMVQSQKNIDNQQKEKEQNNSPQ